MLCGMHVVLRNQINMIKMVNGLDNQPRIDQLEIKDELRRQGELRMGIEDSFHITDTVNFLIVKDV